MHQLIATLLDEAPVLTDGAWGTEMQQVGLGSGDCPYEWNLTQPARVEAVARSYVEAGSRVILTNTFGSNRIILERHGLGSQAVEISRVGAEISVRAAVGRAAVFASLGPCGKSLLMEEVSEDELLEVFGEQAQALAEGGADAIVVETMSDPAEAVLAVKAAAETGLPVVGCLVYDCGKEMDRTMMGTTPEQAVAQLEAAGADVIGANCGQGIEGFVPICRRYREATELPLWMKANAGLPELAGGNVTYATGVADFVGHVPALIEAGAAFIGGCCGTSPEFIQAVNESLGR